MQTGVTLPLTFYLGRVISTAAHTTPLVGERTFIRLHKSHDVRAFARRAGEESRDSDSRFGLIARATRGALSCGWRPTMHKRSSWEEGGL
jgi:hypothetical protein